MKKILSFGLCLLMLAGCIILPAEAAENVYPTLDDALIVHYDFEGETLEEQLSDKATGGNSKENITTYNSKPGQFEVKNGLGITKSVPTNEAESYPYYSNGITANFDAAAASDATKSGADIVQGITTEYTVYVDFMVIGDGLTKGGTRDMFRISKASNSHPLRVNFTNQSGTQKKVYLQTAILGQKEMTPVECSSQNTEHFYMIAVSAKWNAQSSKWEYKGYLSADDGATYTEVYSAEAADAEKIFAEATMLSLGNYNVNGAPEFRFDDVRVYNKALSAEQLKYAVGQSAKGAVFHGVQTAKASIDYDVRFIGSIDSLEYYDVGFVITAQNGDYKWEKSASKVYKSILGNTTTGIKEYTATELRKGSSGYLFAFSITDIPIKNTGTGTNLEVVFIVTPYYVREYGQKRIEGKSYTVVYSGGEFKSISVDPESGDDDEGANASKFVLDKSKQYSLVYHSDATSANKLAAYLSTSCGLNISAKPDTSTYQNEILLGAVDRDVINGMESYTSGENKYFFGVCDGAYVINSDSRFGLVMGVVYLGDALKASSTILTFTKNDNKSGLIYDLPKDELFAEAVELAKSMYGTYSSVVDKQIAGLSSTVKNDIKLVDELISLMGNSAAFCIGSSSALYDGFIVKCDPMDYSKVTKKDGAGHIWIADAFARDYFGNSVSVVDGYVDISALCNGTDYSLYFDSAKGIAVVTPDGGHVFTSSDSKYITRMNQFFNNSSIPEPDINVEQTRQEIISIDHDPKYIYDYTDFEYKCYGSPEILVRDDAIYITYDIQIMAFPNGGNKTLKTYTVFAKSNDGVEWEELDCFENVTYVGIIEHNGKIILMGTERHENLNTGNIEGRVWIAEYDLSSGTIKTTTMFDAWGTAPTAILIHNGRIYRAYNLGVISADLSDNILSESSWTKTWNAADSETFPKNILSEKKFEESVGQQVTSAWGIEEGNVLLGKDGEIYIIYRIDCGPANGYAAVFKLSDDEKSLVLANTDIGNGIISFPGNMSKFQIKYDEATEKYLSFVSVTTTGGTYNQRNVLYLIASDDLFTWEKIGQPILVEREMMNNKHSEIAHAFQYASFDFSGDDILLIIREATGNSCNYHNANAITLYTFENYANYISR